LRPLLNSGAVVIAFTNALSETFFVSIGFANLTTWDATFLKLNEVSRHADWVQLELPACAIRDSFVSEATLFDGLDIKLPWSVEILQLDSSLGRLARFDLSSFRALRLYPPCCKKLWDGSQPASDASRPQPPAAAPAGPEALADGFADDEQSGSDEEPTWWEADTTLDDMRLIALLDPPPEFPDDGGVGGVEVALGVGCRAECRFWGFVRISVDVLLLRGGLAARSFRRPVFRKG
jgi:hypothetical protein